MLILGKLGIKLLFYINIGLFQSLKNKLSSRWLGKGGNSKIMTISNKYKDTLDNFINSSDPESLYRARPIDERSHNAPRFKNSSADLSEKDCLDEDVPEKLLQLVFKTRDSQIY